MSILKSTHTGEDAIPITLELLLLNGCSISSESFFSNQNRHTYTLEKDHKFYIQINTYKNPIDGTIVKTTIYIWYKFWQPEYKTSIKTLGDLKNFMKNCAIEIYNASDD